MNGREGRIYLSRKERSILRLLLEKPDNALEKAELSSLVHKIDENEHRILIKQKERMAEENENGN